MLYLAKNAAAHVYPEIRRLGADILLVLKK
jgi:hypothetical protein